MSINKRVLQEMISVEEMKLLIIFRALESYQCKCIFIEKSDSLMLELIDLDSWLYYMTDSRDHKEYTWGMEDYLDLRDDL